MNRNLYRALAVIAIVALAFGSYLYLTRSQQSVQPPAETSGPPESPSGDAIRHPIDESGRDAAGEDNAGDELPSLDASDTAVERALTDLLGAEAVRDFLGPGKYIRNVVVTVDNLPRGRASARLWPVQPTPGRFAVRQEGDRTYLSAENFQRYAPFVKLATSVPVEGLVALYVRYYALFQQAYEDLGYPGQYFNDRVIDVIDHLLATPDQGDTIEVVLPPQDPSIEVARPWVLYEYADPALQSLSAGQKILVRMGSDNSSRMKGLLRELRKRLATEPPPGGSPAAARP